MSGIFWLTGILVVILIVRFYFFSSKNFKANSIIIEGPIVDFRSFGAKGDGVTDDTQAFRSALANSGILIIPDGTYMLSAASPFLSPNSNTTIILSPNAILKIIPNNLSYYNIFNLRDKENITIIGGTIEGDRAGHTGTTGEWGMGVGIYGSKNIRLENLTIKNCWGDGIYIAKSTNNRSQNITISDVISTNNRRQGLTITDGANIKVKGCIFGYSNGIAPQAGIDIEPNSGECVENVTIEHTSCVNNLGSGLLLTGRKENCELKNITILNCNVNDNSGAGMNVNAAFNIWFSNTTFDNNSSFGVYAPRDIERIYFHNCTFNNNIGRGMALTLNNQTKLTNNLHFYNCAFEKNTTDGLRIDSDDYTNYPPQNMTFNYCTFRNNNRGISIGAGGIDIRLISCISENNAQADVLPTNTN